MKLQSARGMKSLAITRFNKCLAHGQNRTTREREGLGMSEIRNLDGKLVCRIDDESGIVEIKIKDCITLIKVNPDGTTKVINQKSTAA